jgi:hypothetical protein
MVDPAAKLILIVDDDREARDAVSELLTLCSYTTACAENGQAALDEIRRCAVAPALILLDLVLIWLCPSWMGVLFSGEREKIVVSETFQSLSRQAIHRRNRLVLTRC